MDMTKETMLWMASMALIALQMLQTLLGIILALIKQRRE